MIIGDRLRRLREQKNFSQGEIEKRSGLLRCYISRVENGHTVPAVETLEKFARALGVPMYRLFYDGDNPSKAVRREQRKVDSGSFGAAGKEARLLTKFRNCLARTDERSQGILLYAAKRMAQRKTDQSAKRR